MARRVIVTIDPKTSTMQFEVDGVIGTGCTDITQLLIQGQEVLEEKYKEEYAYEVERPDFIHQEEE